MESGTYSVGLEGRWLLQEFAVFPRTFAQVYAFEYALQPDAPVRDDAQVQRAFRSYPWRGGYSAVNFYEVLGNQIPPRLRPRIKSIHYASPGAIELTLSLAAAYAVSRAVKESVEAGRALHNLYREIYKETQDRKLLRIEVRRQEMKLAREELAFVEQSARRLARMLGFKNLQQLNALTNNPLSTLKILMSYHRRVRKLAELEEEGKLSLPDATDHDQL